MDLERQETVSASAVDYVGPFEHHEVAVDGWLVPFIDAEPLQGGRVLLTLDRRFGLELDLAEAERVVPFLANAIAVGMGYEAHPAGDTAPRRRTEARRFLRLDWTQTEEAP